MLHSLRVADYMAQRLITLSPEMTIDLAIKTLLTHNISGAPVVSQGELVGMFSEADCLEDIVQSGYYEMSSGLVGDVMSSKPETIHANDSILSAAEVFHRHNRRRLPVVDDQGTLVGQISRHDVLRAIDSLTHQNHSH